MLIARMSSRHFFETEMVYAFSWAIARSRGLGLENRAKGSAFPAVFHAELAVARLKSSLRFRGREFPASVITISARTASASAHCDGKPAA